MVSMKFRGATVFPNKTQALAQDCVASPQESPWGHGLCWVDMWAHPPIQNLGRMVPMCLPVQWAALSHPSLCQDLASLLQAPPSDLIIARLT